MLVLLIFSVEGAATFLLPLADKTVKESETVVFECEVSKPNIKAKWLKGSKDVKEFPKMQPSVEGTKHKLTIKDAKVEDVDKYTVVFEDRVESSAQLTVEGTTELK